MTPQELEYQAQLQGELATLRLQVEAYEAKLNSAEPACYAVIEPSGYINFTAGWSEACNEHINDAINEHNLLEAKYWKVIRLFTHPPAPTSEKLPDKTMIECVAGAISKHISTSLYQREVIAAAQYIVHRYCSPAPSEANVPLTGEGKANQLADFIYRFKRHVGGDGEFWLHELEDFYYGEAAARSGK